MKQLRASRALAAVFFFGLLAGLMPMFGQQATVKEEKMSFKTYPFSDPDPTPLIGPIYPYFRFHGFSLEGRPRDWKMVRLENPYVKVLVAPEIGGKVWGALEKSTGREFLYWNPVVKFREIAMRGPWTSGGIELNFGMIGHAPTTATPVDYLLQENADGSVSCIVGAIDLPSRTVWRVNIRLPKDAAYFETECFWYNPTSLHDSLYNWLTSAQDAGDDLKFFYPGRYHIGHGGDVHPWPVAENGRDISVYRNNNFGSSKSYHILGEYNEYFGGYYEKAGFGYGHWALHDDKPGMKLWLWSLARDGEIWRDLLTDPPKVQYVEPQTGLLYNQAGIDSSLTPFKHVHFPPQSVMRWRELWFPVKDIGGLVAASPYAALNVESDKEKLKVGICPLQPINDELVVTLAGQPIFSGRLALAPLETFNRTFDVGEKQGEIKVTLGGEKLAWTSLDKEMNRLGRPVTSPPDFDWTSAEGLYVAGEELSRQRSDDEALRKFQACLEKEPGHVRALTRVAEILYKRIEYLKALDYARDALAIDAYDPAANFIYGVINRWLGNLADAKDGFGWAARSLEYRSAAYEQLAEIGIVEKRLERAAEYATRSLDYNAYNLNTRRIQAIIRRLEKDAAAAEKELEEIAKVDPLSHFARLERYLLNPSEANREAFRSLVRGELPHETYLELALFYFNLGLTTEAVRALEMAPSHPLIDYWLAYLHREDDPAGSRECFDRAVMASPALVFPHRRETIPVLRWAAAKDGGWKSSYYLGLVLWNIGKLQEAKGLFERLESAPDWAPFYLTRAKLRAEGEDGSRVLEDIQKSIGLDRGNWRAWRAQTEFYEKSGDFAHALKSAQTVYKQQPEKPALAMDYAKALLHSGQSEECLGVLGKTTVLPYEGAWEGHDLYRQANLLLGATTLRKGNARKAAVWIERARLWPENLGVGEPFDVDERLENFLAAEAAEKTGDHKKEEALYRAVCADSVKFGASRDALQLLGAMAFKKTGQEDQALRLLDGWRAARGEENPVYRWAAAVFQGDWVKAEGVLTALRQTAAGAAWDMGTGDRNFPLVIRIVEGFSQG
jgi:tetratricopeptide (TPR) repeat protein